MTIPTHQTTIIQMPELTTEEYNLGNYFKSYDGLWSKIYESINAEGSLWILVSNQFIQGERIPLAWELAERIRAKTKFKLKNIFVAYHKFPEIQGLLAGAYYDILFFVKSLEDYYFDKDTLREPHIFKDIEWGKRSVGGSGYNDRISTRYSEKGRDPGNVFYKTDRAKDGTILKIYEFTEQEIYEKIVKVSSKQENLIVSNLTNSDFANVVSKLNRRLTLIGDLNEIR